MKTKRQNQSSHDEIKARIDKLGITQRYLATTHRRYPQQITQALNGEQPGLLNRILKHLDRLEKGINTITFISKDN